MITGMMALRFACVECGERADYRVTRTNDELPAGHVQWGERNICYCKSHLPEDCATFFGSALYPGEEAYIET